MENNIDDIIKKFTPDVMKNIRKDNVEKIISFLYKNKCNVIDDIILNYFDLLTIDYDDFIKKFESLNIKYNYNYLKLVEQDLNYLEELF